MPDARRAPDAPPDHPTSAQVAAYLDGRLRGAEREAVVSHLAACAACRRELVELREALAAAAPPRARRWGAVAAAVAAALAFVMLPRLLVRPDGGDDPTPGATRAPGGARPLDTAPPIEAVSPADGAAVPGGAPALVWRAVGADAMYLVTVQDTAGTIVWSTAVTDTTATFPRAVPLAAGHRYFWSVDARLADGQATKTGVRSFTVR